MRLLLPDAEVVSYSAYGLTRRFPAMGDLVRALSPFDLVFATAFAAPFRDRGTFETLRGAVRLVPIPTIVFPAFHPDIVYVGDESDPTGRGFVRGPVGTYHSALALFAFLEGYTVERALRLFDKDVYRLLGYFDLWDASTDTLLRLGRDADYDLSGELMRWARRGAFMHVINHPKMYVACDLARGLLGKAGIPFADCDLDSYAADEILRLGSWPVYGAVAEQFGVRGGETFLLPATKAEPPRTLGLRPFLEASFAAYRAEKPGRLRNDRVELWRGSDSVKATLSDLTR
jgi:hypothetical protein